MPSVPAGLPQAPQVPRGGTPAGAPADLTELVKIVLPQPTLLLKQQELPLVLRCAAAANSSERRKELHKPIPKPTVFAPEDRTRGCIMERLALELLKHYCAVSDDKFEDDIAYVEGNNATEVGIDFLEDEERHRGRFPYSFLNCLLQGRFLSLVRGVDRSNGIETLRQLFKLPASCPQPHDVDAPERHVKPELCDEELDHVPAMEA